MKKIYKFLITLLFVGVSPVMANTLAPNESIAPAHLIPEAKVAYSLVEGDLYLPEQHNSPSDIVILITDEKSENKELKNPDKNVKITNLLKENKAVCSVSNLLEGKKNANYIATSNKVVSIIKNLSQNADSYKVNKNNITIICQTAELQKVITKSLKRNKISATVILSYQAFIN